MNKRIKKILDLRNQMATLPEFRYGEFDDGSVFFTDSRMVVITSEIEPLVGFKSQPMNQKIIKDLLNKTIENSDKGDCYTLPVKTAIKKAASAHRKTLTDKYKCAYDFTGCGKCCANPDYIVSGIEVTDDRRIWCYSHREPLLMADESYGTYVLILPVNILGTAKQNIFTIES